MVDRTFFSFISCVRTFIYQINATMELLKRMFTTKSSSGLRIRFSKSLDQWQVYRENSIVYVGNKDSCQRYMDNWASA